MTIQLNQIPLISTINHWWTLRAQNKELAAATKALTQMSHASVIPNAPQLIEHAKKSPELKREVAKLERAYFIFLKKTGKPIPAHYSAQENLDMVAKFSILGITPRFLRNHPEFLSHARDRFWLHYFPFVQFPIRMKGNQLYFRVENRENSARYQWVSWSELSCRNLGDMRITYQGFALGHPDRSSCLVPLKTVPSGDKYALQFVTSCPVGRRLPSSIDFKDSGHSFTQIIIPKRKTGDAEVFSVGFYPRKVADFGMQFFKTVPGVYRNHDSNVSRIQAGQVIPVVKQYLLHQDRTHNPCLFSLIKNMKAIRSAMKAEGHYCASITLKDVEKAMLERNEPELDRILIELTQIRKHIVSGKIRVKIKPMTRAEKAQVMKERFEKAQGKHSYHMLGSNCTAVSFREEAFAVAFLDATLDADKAIKVYNSQVDIRDYHFGFLDRLRNILERVFLHFFAALPLTGPLLGIGFTHPDTPESPSNRLIPSVLSNTASATHELLSAPFVNRPLFPAGELMARKTPVIHPPGVLGRLKYLFHRSLLLNSGETETP